MVSEDHRLAEISSDPLHHSSEPSDESLSAPSTLGKTKLGASVISASRHVAVIGMYQLASVVPG
jgi:hypothetical protein